MANLEVNQLLQSLAADRHTLEANAALENAEAALRPRFMVQHGLTHGLRQSLPYLQQPDHILAAARPCATHTGSQIGSPAQADSQLARLGGVVG